MKTNSILDIMKTNNIVIPSYLLKTYKKLNLSEKELIFLSYLITFNDKILFDINKFSISTSLSIPEIMELIDSLTSKNIITMVTDKKETGMIREYLDISSLYDKIIVMTLNDSENEIVNKDNSNIYDVIEKEFGRCLSPIEYETIKGWLDSNISEDLIKEALKEAISERIKHKDGNLLNGVNNLKYIDRILYEWNKKGYKKPSDVVKKRQVKEEKIDLFDYDWLDEE